MLLSNREIAFVGLMMAFSVLLVTLGGYIESSTLFFLAAASFLTGVIERNFSLLPSALFLVGSSLLSLILAPQKVYVATFAFFGIYILVAEYFEKKLFLQEKPSPPPVEWGMKAIVYHILFISAVFLTKEFLGFDALNKNKLFTTIWEKKALFILAVIAVAEVIWLVFDRAYIFFQRRYGRFFLVNRDSGQ